MMTSMQMLTRQSAAQNVLLQLNVLQQSTRVVNAQITILKNIKSMLMDPKIGDGILLNRTVTLRQKTQYVDQL